VKIFMWAASMSDGTWWYRLHLVAEALKARGHDVRVSMRIGEWARDHAQIIVGQRVCNPRSAIMWRELAKPANWTDRPRPKLVYEIDDDLLSIDPRTNDLAAFGAGQRALFDEVAAIRGRDLAADLAATPKHARHWRRFDVQRSSEVGAALERSPTTMGQEFHDFRDPRVQAAMRESIGHADLVTVTVPQLAEAIRPHNPSAAVLPNSIPAKLLNMPPQRKPLAGRVLIGWQGSATHTRDWQVAAPAVLDVLGEHQHAHMRFLGTWHPAGMNSGQVSFLGWTTDLWEHYRRVSKFHIGLAPLENTLFNRSKSPLRAVEMMALGVPGIYSRVPAYEAVVTHSVNGFLAGSPAEWRHWLNALLTDEELRARIGDAARQTARAWTIEERVKLWESAYQSLLDS
jgi:glycosyltransferase involved in cell wall biosynthesis